MSTAQLSESTYRVLFVGGAPRSGTTVTHALICTSQKSNRYVAESSYLSHLIKAYKTGIKTWNSHTNSFFAKPEHFCQHMGNLLWFALNRLHMNLGKPEILALKDPLLTPFFPEVNELLGTRVSFVTVVRDPYDVVRSRQEVFAKMHEGKKPFGLSQAKFVALEYMSSYQHLHDVQLKSRLFVVQYERIVELATIEALAGFVGVDDIDPDRMWGGTDKTGAEPEKAPESNDPWFSPKYRKPLNLERRLSELAPEMKAVVDRICAPMQREFGYAHG